MAEYSRAARKPPTLLGLSQIEHRVLSPCSINSQNIYDSLKLPGVAAFAGDSTLDRPAARKRSEGETAADYRSEVAVVLIRNAGAVRNGDGQTARHVRIRNSGKTVETLGKVMIRIERPFV